MSLIKIVANGVELDFVKDTLSIKKENNALIRDFKVSYSSVPFLIIENGNTKKALGTRDLASIKKIKTINVAVFEGGKKYVGELQILSYINGFRKCNLKYATQILTIINRKISEFMPVVSVIPGESSPIPFTESFSGEITGIEHWETYPIPFLNQGFPDVKWQFPTMQWKDKFGVGLESTDEWFYYKNEINKFNEDQTLCIKNYYTEDSVSILDVFNQNVVAPQIYLLAPLFYALQFIGFDIDGGFSENDFIKRILFLSTKNNLTKNSITKSPIDVIFTGIFEHNIFGEYTKKTISLPSGGTYVVNYDFTLYGPVTNLIRGGYHLDYKTTENTDLQFVFTINNETTSPVNVTGSININLENAAEINFFFWNFPGIMPLDYSLTIHKEFSKEYYAMHPTIELGRYLPDWTFGTYLNAIQNLFNLEINSDDLIKKMTIDFNDDSLINEPPYIVKKSLAITAYEQTPFNSFFIKYANDQDPSLWITTDGVTIYTNQTSDFVEKIENKFKFVPSTYTSSISEDLESKNGIGLMIYNHENAPYTAYDFSGKTLKIEGIGGIHDLFWKKTIHFRLNSSLVEMSGPFTETELNFIVDLKRIFVDNQEYIIAFIEYSETEKQNFNVKFSLQSINL
jgi:hypothetical protein